MKKIPWRQRWDVFIHLSSFGAVCSRPCLCAQREFENPNSNQAGTCKVLIWRKCHVPNRFNWKCKKNYYAKADSLVDKYLSCPRIKPSKSQFSKLDGVKTRVSLSDFAHQLRRKNADVRDSHSTLLDAAGLSPAQELNRNTRDRDKRSWVLFRLWTANVWNKGGAAYCSVRNLVKTSNLPVSKVKLVPYSKSSCTKNTPTTFKFNRINSFENFINGNWCKDLAYLDKLPENKKGADF